MPAYYNEIDPYAAQWLRNLIAAGHINDGDVDERSIEDVKPDDLKPYTQCHFFAGIGVWSYALRQAGWPDDKPVWTGSCPCQPFSSAGKGKGFADERHLWPAFFHLIQQCKPDVIFGEQVASKDGLAWLDLVQIDLEAESYTTAALDLCAAGFGAPHIRQRLYWLADTRCFTPWHESTRFIDQKGAGNEKKKHKNKGDRFTNSRKNNGLAYIHCTGLERWEGMQCSNQVSIGSSGLADGLGHTECDGLNVDAFIRSTSKSKEKRRLLESQRPDTRNSLLLTTNATKGFWRDADWLHCRDGRWRPVESSTSPLAHGITGRVGRLRAYGNAIVAPVAEEFIRAFLEVQP